MRTLWLVALCLFGSATSGCYDVDVVADSDGDADADSDSDGDADVECTPETVEADCGAPPDPCLVVTCNGGQCSTDLMDCSDGVDCTTDSCSAGECLHTLNPDACSGATPYCDMEEGCIAAPSCDAENPCPGAENYCVPETCENEVCVQGDSPCAAGDDASCTGIACDEASDTCSEPADHGACDDDVECTVDLCDPTAAGADPDTGCVTTNTDAVCDDGAACTTDTCDPTAAGADAATGCLIAPVDASCTADAYTCTAEVCDPSAAGADATTGCVSNPNSVACDDAIGCTNNTCDPTAVGADPTSGCLTVNDSAPCADAYTCTINTCDPSAVGADAVTGCAIANDDTVCDDGRCNNHCDPSNAGADAATGCYYEDPCATSDPALACIREQVRDMTTRLPVTAADNLTASVFDTGVNPPVVIASAPVDQPNGCVVIRNIPLTATASRSVGIRETEASPDPDRVVHTRQQRVPGNVAGTCCDEFLWVINKADSQEWNTALGFADDIEACGAWAGYVLDSVAAPWPADPVPVVGATVTNFAADFGGRYFNDDLTGLLEGATATGPSGGWILRSACARAGGQWSAFDAANNTYSNHFQGIGTGLMQATIIYRLPPP